MRPEYLERYLLIVMAIYLYAHKGLSRNYVHVMLKWVIVCNGLWSKPPSHLALYNLLTTPSMFMPYKRGLVQTLELEYLCPIFPIASDIMGSTYKLQTSDFKDTSYVWSQISQHTSYQKSERCFFDKATIGEKN